MAKAPRPGVSTRAEASDTAKKVMRLTIRGESRTLAIGSIPFKERQICRKATGFPIEAYIGEDTFGLDSLQVCWWLAGRAAGDPFLTLSKVTEDDDMWDGLTAEDIEVEVEDPDDEADDPEA